jgi:hypothetical protein
MTDLPGEAWDDATEGLERYYGPGAGWRGAPNQLRIRVLRWALRRACADVLRLGGEGSGAPGEGSWAPQTADELADGYTEWAEATLLVGEVELEEGRLEERRTQGGGSGAPSGG